MRAYFQSLGAALGEAGVARPVLVIDKARLDHNIDQLKRVIARGFRYRVVAKSLPSVPLLRYVFERCGTQSLMCFHMPFMLQLLDALPESDVLLGKPMPVRALDDFEAWACASNVPEHAYARVQWLIDDVSRLERYESFARRHGRTLQVSLELDIGLHRGGFAQEQDFVTALQRIQASPHINLAGLMGYEAHITKIPRLLGGWRLAAHRAKTRYAQFLGWLQQAGFSPDSLCLNVGGSTTYPLYESGDLAFCNEISVASALVKPSDFDVFTLAHHQPAMWIATPVLKTLDSPSLPGPTRLSQVLRKVGVLPTEGVFIYGGNWMADPVYPAGSSQVKLFGHSSNQEMYGLPHGSALQPEDWFFLRPRQSEAVMLQFGRIAVFDRDRITDWWPALGQDVLDPVVAAAASMVGRAPNRSAKT